MTAEAGGGTQAGRSGGVLEMVSLVELTAGRVRQEILSGELPPGSRLIEEQLTRRFGISRAPVREALRLLGEQGLVEHLPRRGSRVASLSDRDADELFELRDLLERHAVEVGLDPSAGPGLSALSNLLTVMDRSAKSGEMLREAEAHRDFHIALVGLAGHRQLSLTYAPIILKLQLYMAANLRREAEQRAALEGVRRHRRLLDAVRVGDRERISRELAEHGSRRYFRTAAEGG